MTATSVSYTHLSLRIGFNGIFCFSTYALTLSTMFGFIIAGFSFLLMAIYLFYKLMGWQILWGNPTLVILISFLGGIQDVYKRQSSTLR